MQSDAFSHYEGSVLEAAADEEPLKVLLNQFDDLTGDAPSSCTCTAHRLVHEASLCAVARGDARAMLGERVRVQVSQREA